jgi:hypothetical protein
MTMDLAVAIGTMPEKPIEIGKRYRFDYPEAFTSLPEYTARRGEIVTVLRKLSEDEADGHAQGVPDMFAIRDKYGWEGEAWEDELKEIEG